MSERTKFLISSLTIGIVSLFLTSCPAPGGNTPQQVADPIFSPVAGSYGAVQNVTISTTTSGASIRYTTDGSRPTDNSGLLYTGSTITVAQSMTIQAIAYESGWTDSKVVVSVYTIIVGTVYGQIIWDGTLFYSTPGSFPSTVTYGNYYKIAPGTYNYQYYVYYNGYYYPGGSASFNSLYYVGTFTVTQVYGSDEYFTLYFSYTGCVKSGAVSYIAPPSQGSKPLKPVSLQPGGSNQLTH
jgi:hypothetical protein